MKNKLLSAIPNVDHGHSMAKSPRVAARGGRSEASRVRSWALLLLDCHVRHHEAKRPATLSGRL